MRTGKIFMLLLITVLALSCRKDVPVPASELNAVFGKWEWVSSSGGITGAISTPASEGYTQSVEFDRKGMSKWYKNDKRQEKKRFTLSSSTDQNGVKTDYINYETDTKNEKQVVSFDASGNMSLSGGPGCADCLTSAYRRK